VVALFQELRRELSGHVSRTEDGGDAVAARMARAGTSGGGTGPADRSQMLSELLSRSGLHNAVEEEAQRYGATLHCTLPRCISSC
jgi:hypothetical protein